MLGTQAVYISVGGFSYLSGNGGGVNCDIVITVELWRPYTKIDNKKCTEIWHVSEGILQFDENVTYIIFNADTMTYLSLYYAYHMAWQRFKEVIDADFFFTLLYPKLSHN